MGGGERVQRPTYTCKIEYASSCTAYQCSNQSCVGERNRSGEACTNAVIRRNEDEAARKATELYDSEHRAWLPGQKFYVVQDSRTFSYPKYFSDHSGEGVKANFNYLDLGRIDRRSGEQAGPARDIKFEEGARFVCQAGRPKSKSTKPPAAPATGKKDCK